MDNKGVILLMIKLKYSLAKTLKVMKVGSRKKKCLAFSLSRAACNWNQTCIFHEQAQSKIQKRWYGNRGNKVICAFCSMCVK